MGWDQATRVEARDFCRWLQSTRKPTRPHWCYPAGDAPGSSQKALLRPVDGSSGCHAWLMSAARCVAPSVAPSAFAGFRFPSEVITLSVRWYLRFGLSYRDVEELLAERGINVDHVSIFRWVQRFTPLLAEAARPCRHRVGDRWWVDETYVKVSGRWHYVYRAIDQFGQVIDVYVSTRRDSAAARCFFIGSSSLSVVCAVGHDL